MEIIQELGHSYIVIDDDTRGDYEYMREMLTHNEIPGILGCKKVLFNNRRVLKYDITNKKSLSKEYESRLLGYEEIKDIITNLSDIIVKSCSYLLEETMFVIDPDMIYRDLETGEIELLYIPFDRLSDPLMAVAGRYYRFNDFLLDKTNHLDEKAVNLIYKFYKMAKEEFFSIESFSQSMLHEKSQSDNENVEDYLSSDEILDSKTLDLAQSDEIYSINKLGLDYKEEIKDVEKEAIDDNQVDFTGNLILTLAAVGAFLVYTFFFKDNIYGNYLFLSSIILGISDIIWLMRNLYKIYENNRIKKLEGIDEAITVDEYWREDSIIQYI